MPVDKAFERHGFDLLSDDVLASDQGVKMLLNHFVRGRLYDRDLRHDEVFETIGGNAIRIQRHTNEGKFFFNRIGRKFIIYLIFFNF